MISKDLSEFYITCLLFLKTVYSQLFARFLDCLEIISVSTTDLLFHHAKCGNLINLRTFAATGLVGYGNRLSQHRGSPHGSDAGLPSRACRNEQRWNQIFCEVGFQFSTQLNIFGEMFFII